MLTLLLSGSLITHSFFPPRNDDQVPPPPPREPTISYYVDSACSLSNPFCF